MISISNALILFITEECFNNFIALNNTTYLSIHFKIILLSEFLR